jgi:hypothetical protein
MALPSLRQILTTLLKDLEIDKDIFGDATPNADLSVQSSRLPGDVLSQTAPTALLALHQIYPHLLLSSLDRLDNALVTEYVVPTAVKDDSYVAAPIFYVRSAQNRSSRYGTQASRTAYEVHPASWHCTCPSFAFSAFSSRNSFDPFTSGEEDYPGADRWGGEMRGGQLAICKHLLAVLIGLRIRMIPRKEVDMNTLAGYAFGEANS